MRALGTFVAAGALALLAAGAASAHVTVWPRESVQGARERYTVRMPNEKDVATVRVEAQFPADVLVSGFEQKPGWTLEIKRAPDGRIVGAVWTGSLPPTQFVEFGIAARNPKTVDSLAWKFIQTYEGDVKVEWTGAPGSNTPASVVKLNPAPPTAAPAAGH